MRKQRGKKKRAKARKDEVVPRGRLFMPGVRLIELLAALVHRGAGPPPEEAATREAVPPPPEQ